MIAKLPGGDSSIGDDLEMMLVFQAAEIERLASYLDTFQLKYKEIEKIHLDRHSYEVQIKELAQRLQEGDGFKLENQKLKDFIRKQTAELEEWKKKTSDIDVNIQRKYENALKQIDTMLQDNIGLKNENNSLKGEVNQLRARFEALDRAKTKELEDIREQFEGQKRIVIEREIREVSTKFQAERSQMEIEIRRLRENNDGRLRENEDLRNKINSLNAKLQELAMRSDNKVEL